MSGVEPRRGVLKIKAHMSEEDADQSSRVQINVSGNESAYGPSPEVIEAAKIAVTKMERYATNGVSNLAKAISSRFDLDPDWIVCGHGSDDLLARIARVYLSPGNELICSVNGYQKFPNYAHANDAIPVQAGDDHFKADIDSILSCLTNQTRIVTLANPDNPTGTYLNGKEIRELHENLPKNVLLVLDSAYLEYTDATNFENPIRLIQESSNVIMTRTFSKLYGLAGIRLGWAFARPEIANAVRKVGTTFPLSNVASVCGCEALKDREHSKFVYENNLAVRNQFVNNLAQLGVESIPSQTNFVLVRFDRTGYSAVRAYKFMRANGILARRMASDSFLQYIRITIGLKREMEETIQVIKEFLATDPVSDE